MQRRKASEEISRTPRGMLMVRKEEQSENAALSIEVKEAGKVMSESAWQLAKAEAPMLVTAVGSVTDLSEVQPVKAFAGMVVT